MNNSQLAVDAVRLAVYSGPGLIVRSPGMMLVLPDVTDRSLAAERVISLCTDAGAPRGAALLRRVAYLLGEPDVSEVPGFCLLVGDTSATRLLAHGEVEVLLPGGEVVSAVPYITWIERSLPELNGLTITAPDQQAPGTSTSPRLDLRHGIVPGGGARLLLSEVEGSPVSTEAPKQASPVHAPAAWEPKVSAPPAPVVPPGPAPAPPEPASSHDDTPPTVTPHRPPPALLSVVDELEETQSLKAPTVQREVVAAPRQPSFEAVLLTGEAENAADSGSTPLPISGDHKTDAEQVLVKGIVCSRGHFNDPGSAYCGFCGISMVQRTHEFVSAPRPTLGVLIFDDGAAFSVDGDYVLGREPELDPTVASGKARPLTLTDEESTISRVHAVLRLDNWRTLVEDRGSANGTFVSRSDKADGWHRLSTGQPAELTPGQRIRFGRRVAVFESHVRQA